ncbi:MAG TPA: hypothetical protein GXX20_09705 [Clostridiaceae bacterium]|nr:hypothetical protein [Clostridiaceae bacterium]
MLQGGRSGGTVLVLPLASGSGKNKREASRVFSPCLADKNKRGHTSTQKESILPERGVSPYQSKGDRFKFCVNSKI